MATALHSRHLLTTDLDDQAEDAKSQLAALDTAEELGMSTDRGIEGECLELYLYGDADQVTTLVKRLWERDIYITWITPENDDEQALLVNTVYGMAEIGEI